ncbi:DUF58 domain-containing protein [Halobacteriales archaeon QH_7_65_31]|nr:MAG: DUF58 domain-containing protein [Halobacteriales archaeon QH_7_65_31]
MTLTRRGYATIAVVVVGVWAGVTAGPRTLNAIVMPALVLTGYSWLSVRRRAPPTVTRSQPSPGFPGESREIELRAESGGPTTITDSVGERLRQYEVSSDGYCVELTERGIGRLGPATTTETDVFGLVSRTGERSGETELLVYPTVEPLAPSRRFEGLVEEAGSPERDAFTSLREYVPGDPLRNVHWPSSAKREPGELVVTQYAAPDEGGITVVATSDDGCADAMATAAASVVVHLLDRGLSVGVIAPNGRVPERRGPTARTEALELLARTGAGRPPDEADVRIDASETETTVGIDDESFAFDELTAEGRS